MTFSIDDSVVEKECSEDQVSAMIAESKEARKHLRKLVKVMKTVATHRLKELRDLEVVEKLATWRRTCGFDRIADDDNQLASCPLPPTSEKFTASLWSDLNELKDAISLSGKDGSRQRTKSFIKQIGRGTVSFTDVELAMLKRFVERRDRDAAHVIVASLDTAQYCSPPSRSFEISADVRFFMEKNKEGRMGPEPDQLEPPSDGTGFEIPGQQYPPNGEIGRTTADGCLLVAVGSKMERNTFSPTERVIGTRTGSVNTTSVTSSKTTSQRTRHKLDDKKAGIDENKQFDPGGKGEEPPPWKAAVLVVFSFLGVTWAWVPVVCALCFCLCVHVRCESFLSGTNYFPAS